MAHAGMPTPGAGVAGRRGLTSRGVGSAATVVLAADWAAAGLVVAGAGCLVGAGAAVTTGVGVTAASVVVVRADCAPASYRALIAANFASSSARRCTSAGSCNVVRATTGGAGTCAADDEAGAWVTEGSSGVCVSSASSASSASVSAADASRCASTRMACVLELLRVVARAVSTRICATVSDVVADGPLESSVAGTRNVTPTRNLFMSPPTKASGFSVCSACIVDCTLVLPASCFAIVHSDSPLRTGP